MTKARIVGLGFGVLMIVAAFGIVLWQTANMPATGTAFAQGAATATPSAGAQATPAPQQQDKDTQKQQIGEAFWTLLASKLGVSADDLKAKAIEARKEMIDQAVKDGRITQEQADAIKARMDANGLIVPINLGRGGRPNMPPQGGNQPNNNNQNPHGGWFGGNRTPRGGFGGLGKGMKGGGLEQIEAVAQVLKLEPKALIEQLSQGKTLADIAKAQGVEEAVVKQAIIDSRKAQIDQLLALGVISEVQANQMKARLTPENIDLSRGFRFQFHTAPGQQDSSQMMPSFGSGEGFSQMFGQMFGDAFNQQVPEPFGDIQTQ